MWQCLIILQFKYLGVTINLMLTVYFMTFPACLANFRLLTSQWILMLKNLNLNINLLSYWFLLFYRPLSLIIVLFSYSLTHCNHLSHTLLPWRWNDLKTLITKYRCYSHFLPCFFRTWSFTVIHNSLSFTYTIYMRTLVLIFLLLSQRIGCCAIQALSVVCRSG